MPKLPQNIAKVMDLFGQSREPLSAHEVRESLGEISRITTIRRLNYLVQKGLVEVVGGGRSTKYQAVKRIPFRISVPVGLDSADIEEYVCQPKRLRERVGYQRALLDSYKPNVTKYLEDPVLENLHRAGHLSALGRYDYQSKEGLRTIQQLVVDLSHGSSKLENVDTEYLQTERLVLLGEGASTERDRESITIILNHKDAIELLVGGVLDEEGLVPSNLNLPTVYDVHSQLMKGLLIDSDAIGRVRHMRVDISGSSYEPENDPSVLQDMLEEMLTKSREIEDPFEQSFFVLIHLSYLQPFVDGNKRTARVMANIPLLRAGLCPLSFLATPKSAYVNGILGVYEMNRTELIRDVYVSSYMKSAYHFHHDRERSLVPSQLSFRFRSAIDDKVKELIIGIPKDPIRVLDAWVRNQSQLELPQQSELKRIVIEKCRNMTEVLARTLGIDAESYRRWDAQRSIHVNEIELPSLQTDPDSAGKDFSLLHATGRTGITEDEVASN